MHNDLTGPKAPNKGIEPLPLRGKWLNDADEVLSYLERHHDGAPATMHAPIPIELLKQAHDIIEQADERISELEQLSVIDTLTGLTNRRGFMDSFSRELDRLNRTPDSGAKGGLLVMIDLDNFTAIERTYGIEASLAALRVTARTLASDIRIMDIAARFEGDEFVILLANTTRKDALERAQSLIKRLNSLSFVWRGEEIPVRASLGLKEYKKGSTVERIFSAADANLIGNKQMLKHLPIRQNNKDSRNITENAS